MRYKTLTTITAILSSINALFYLFIPSLSLSILDSSTNAMGIMNTRVSGACAMGLSVITWLARDFKVLKFQRMIAQGNLITLGILTIIDIDGIYSGIVNEWGWVIFFADFILAAGFLIFLFKTTAHDT
ncbi:MAG: hypothetical protein MUP03_06280 [Anaerolineales bacterium]|nr:hypothetical protein [Anaerolineales bacterium]